LISEGHTCSRGIWLAAASTVSAAKPPALAASLPSSRPSLSAAAARLDLDGKAQRLHEQRDRSSQGSTADGAPLILAHQTQYVRSKPAEASRCGAYDKQRMRKRTNMHT